MQCGVKFSMLRKLLANDRHFSPDNVWKYLALHVNTVNRLSKSLSCKMVVHKCHFLLQLLFTINAYFSRFYCKKLALVMSFQ